MKPAFSLWILFIAFLLSVWLAVGAIVYRFRHPEKTETQLLKETGSALLFR